MSKKALYLGLAIFIVLAAVTFLVVGPGWCHKAPAGGRKPPVWDGLAALGKSIPAADAKAHALIRDFGRVPVYFVPNRGQTDQRVGFTVRGADKTIFFTPDGLTLALRCADGPGSIGEADRWTVKLDFVGAREDAAPEGLEPTGASISYFKGKPENWRAGLPAYSRIIYRDLWPGIDLAYKGELDQLKYEFVVRPGADPAAIKMAYRGVDHLALTDEGRLEVKTPAGKFLDDAPVAYQELEGGRRDVPAAYLVDPATAGPGSGTQAFGFALGPYDRGRVLVIDPAVLVYCGFIGGADVDSAFAIAVDTLGFVYVTGNSHSTESSFPAVAGPDLAHNGDSDAFIAKVDTSGTSLIYCGYIGGSGADICGGIAVDATGNAYVAGSTQSSEATFPVKVGPDLTYNGGDSFVAKVDPSGTALVYCGYIGATGFDFPTNWPADIAVDSAGCAYVTGSTSRNESSFPVRIGPDLTYNGGSYDAYVAKVDASGSDLVYCGYIGGSGSDGGGDVAVDELGNAYLTGETRSTESSFPVKVGPDLTFNGVGSSFSDAFVAKVNPSGSDLVYCGYIGGADNEIRPWIAVDDSGSAYLCGQTESTQSTFPVKVGPDLTFNGYNDGFVARVNSSGTGLDYCGYIGGLGGDTGTGIAVDEEGNAYVVGYTGSTEATFPVTDGPDLTYNGGDDVFVAKINSSGTALLYCGYIGGSGDDQAAWAGGGAIAVDGSGCAYIVGETSSSEATFPVLVGPDLTFNGTRDAFVAKVGDIPGPPLTSLVPDSADAGDPGFTLSVYGSEFVEGAAVRWDGNPRTTIFVSGTELQAAIDAADLAAGKSVAVTVRNPNGGISNALAFTITNPVPVLTGLSATSVTGGSGAFVLTLTGSSFVPNSVVRWNGSDRVTTYVGATELQAAIPASDLATGGAAQVTVYNPAPSGGASNAVAVQVTTYALAATPTSATVTAGQSATYTIQLTPVGGSFDAAVSFICAGLPSKCTATFSPTTVTPGAAAASTTLTLATRSSMGSASVFGTTGYEPPALGLLALVLTLILGSARSQAGSRRLRLRWLTAAAVICLVLLVGSCSSGGGDDDGPDYTGTPKGTHQISVQATSGGMTVPLGITLVVN